MYEETIYVPAGRGATTLWYDGMKKHTFEWQEGSLFALPLNCWYRHFNGQADQPIRSIIERLAPSQFGWHRGDSSSKQASFGLTKHSLQQ
jgi:hypothetical protein